MFDIQPATREAALCSALLKIVSDEFFKEVTSSCTEQMRAAGSQTQEQL